MRKHSMAGLTQLGGFCIALCLLPFSSWADSLTKACPEIELREIAPNTWVHTSWYLLGGRTCTPSNGMVIVGEDRVLLVDTPWTPAQTEQLLDQLKPLIAKPGLLSPRRIVNLFVTHGHSDRAGGLSATLKRGISSYALSRTMIEVARHNTGEITFALPDNHFAFDLGERVVEVFYPGPGHTVDNAVVYDHASKTLFGGCLILSASAINLGFTGDGNVDEWGSSAKRASYRYPDTKIVVPGHGELGGTGLFDHTIKLVERHTDHP